MNLEALIKIGIDSRGAKTGASEVGQALTGLQRHLGALKIDAEQFEKALAFAGKAGDVLRSTLTRVFATVLATGTAAVVVREFMEIEDAMIGVANTTGLAGKELDEMQRRLVALGASIPVPVERLASLVEVGSQLGFKGTKGLTEFAKLIERVGASTGLAGESGAKAISKLLKNANEPVDLANFERIGATLNGLRDATGASAEELLQLASSITQSTSRFGIGTKDALAFAGAVYKMGGNASSTSQVLARLFDVMDKDFLQAFGNNPVKAFQGLLAGLEQVRLRGGNLENALEELGIKIDGRTGRSIQQLMRGSEDLAKMLAIVADETGNVTNLNEGSARVWNSLSNQIKLFWQALKLAGVTLAGDLLENGLKPAVQWLNQFLQSLFVTSDGVAQLTDRGRLVAVVLGGIATAAGLLVAIPLVGWFVGLVQGAYALAGVLTAVLAPALTAIAGVVASVVAFDLGGYFYDEFKIVRTTAAALISLLQEGWIKLQYDFKIAVLAIRNAWDEVTTWIGAKWNLIQAGVLEGLLALPAAVKSALGLTDAGIQDAITKARTAAQEQGNLDFKTEYQKLLDARDEVVRLNQEAYQQVITDIEKEFNGKDRLTGDSYFDRLGEHLGPLMHLFDATTTSAEALKTAADACAPAVAKIVPTDTTPFDELLKRLTKTPPELKKMAEAADRARLQLEQMFQALRLEAQLVGRTNDERERAEAAIKVWGLAMEANANNTVVAFNALADYLNLLEKVQASRAGQRMLDTMKEVQATIDAYGKPRVERDNATDIAKYAEDALRKYSGNLEQAKAATAQFVELLNRRDWSENMQKLADAVGDSVGGAFRDAVYEAKTFEQVAKDVFLNVSKAAFDAFVTRQITDFVSSSISGFLPRGASSSVSAGGRANGGYVAPGSNVWVGERGPERLFVTDQGGFVFPTTPSEATSTSTVTVHMTVMAHDADSFRRSERQIVSQLRSRLGGS